jgi:hypothetical protein
VRFHRNHRSDQSPGNLIWKKALNLFAPTSQLSWLAPNKPPLVHFTGAVIEADWRLRFYTYGQNAESVRQAHDILCAERLQVESVQWSVICVCNNRIDSSMIQLD